jgi:3-hydroxyisobutyrate dehydrogenase-like beta-hydroxyacid dehydrogenase
VSGKAKITDLNDPANAEVLAELQRRAPQVVRLKACPACSGGKVKLPIWRAEVEGWGFEYVDCPVCGGAAALDKDGWQKMFEKLSGGGQGV